MAVIFTYGATTVTFTHDPPKGNYTISRKWMNPRTSSGGADSFVYDKSLVRDIETLKWNVMTVADVANLLTFLDAVDGSANPFDYTDVNGVTRPAFIWNSDEIRSYPIQILLEGLTVELFILPYRTKTLTEVMTMTDLLNRSVTYNRGLSDTVSMSDSLTVLLNGAWLLGLSDTITMSDLQKAVAWKNKSESITMSDSFSGAISIEGILSTNSGDHITDESGNHITAKVI
jgi:hypothetical protein